MLLKEAALQLVSEIKLLPLRHTHTLEVCEFGFHSDFQSNVSTLTL